MPVGTSLVLVESAILVKNAVFTIGLISYFNFIYVDALSAFFIFAISVVAFAAALVFYRLHKWGLEERHDH